MKNKTYLMVHADDAGLCFSENRATIDAVQNGIVSSYSIMVPCKGFEEIAAFALKNPVYDYGIHLTLTCEWEKQRFGPVSPLQQVPTLVDEHGHFFKKREILKATASAEEVKIELEAQVQKALDYGLNPSHLDSHMYSVGISREVFEIYRALGKKYNLPVFMNHKAMNMVSSENYILSEDEIIPHMYMGSYEYFEKGKLMDYYTETLTNLPTGLNIFLVHTAYDDAEMQDIAYEHPNFGSEWRQLDFDFCTDKKTRELLVKKGIQLVNWKDVQKLRQEGAI